MNNQKTEFVPAKKKNINWDAIREEALNEPWHKNNR